MGVEPVQHQREGLAAVLGERARARETFERAMMSGVSAPTDPWLTYIRGYDPVSGQFPAGITT